MARTAPAPQDPTGFIMTPMIDVTFQLIIFFLIVTDLSDARVAVLDLPDADTARRRRPEDPDTVIVNILRNGNVIVDGALLHDHALRPDDAGNLEGFFRNRRGIRKHAAGYPLLIRADRAADWIHAQKVMTIATRLGGVAKIHDVECAAVRTGP